MRVYLVAITATMLSLPAAAQQFTATCKYEGPNNNNAPANTRGEISISVTFRSPNGPKNVHFKTTFAPCFDFVANGDDLKVEGSCAHDITDPTGPTRRRTWTFVLDRVTGMLQQTPQTDDLRQTPYYARCVKAEPIFQ
jgi:hypothetical protein